MHRLTHFIVGHAWVIVAVWLLGIATATPFALRLGAVAQGGSEAIRGSESHAVMTTLNREFGRGAAYAVPVVVTSTDTNSGDPRFVSTVTELTTHLAQSTRVRRVLHAWNSGSPELRGRDGRS